LFSAVTGPSFESRKPPVEYLPHRPSSPDLVFHSVRRQAGPGPPGPRIIICDYSPTSQSVTGLLRLNGFHVFQAYDEQGAEELCRYLPGVRLLVLNTDGTDVDVIRLVDRIRAETPNLPVLHIGSEVPHGLPADIRSLSPAYGLDGLPATAERLIERRRPSFAPIGR
jgi:hypothetical protein